VFLSSYIGSMLGVVQQQIGFRSFGPGIRGGVLAGIPWFLAGALASILVARVAGPRSAVDQFLLILVIAAQHLLGSGVLQTGLAGLGSFVMVVGLMNVLGALVAACLLCWLGRTADGMAA
jgi:hypothetical protein